ncbi:ABC transporter permease [Brevibacillus ruminantium]|uniref:ABC transporter permease n=1 Tax=Brevibacillus ruminantium TaxID=2950604 RepID=A0ABY4WKA9_9BACL|nr:ABC transporter permease [Brevibacillus ruminantium]USG66578.1 ABC transporter permease [Brevibacillus ruminantium]
MMFWRVSWRNLTRKKLRSFFTILSILIGVSSIFAVVSTVETAKDVTTKRLELYTGNADYSILANSYTFPDRLLADIQQDGHVQAAIGVMHKQAKFDLGGSQNPSQTSLRITGLSSIQNELLTLEVISGKPTNDGIVIPRSTAQLWGKSAGDLIHLQLPTGDRQVPIAAIVKDTPLLEGPVNWEEASSKSWRALSSLQAVQHWYGLEGQVQEIRLQFREQADEQASVASLRNTTAGYPVYLEKIVLDEKQTNQLEELYLMLYAIGGLAMIISAFILYNTLYVSVVERKNEIAVMKTVGFIPAQIKKLFLCEVLILSLFGLLFGIPLGFGLATVMQEGLFNSFQTNISYSPSYVLTLPITILLGLCIPLVASLLPVSYASKVDVIATLKQVPTQKKAHTKTRVIVGLVLLLGMFVNSIVSLLFLLAGITLLFPFLMGQLIRLLKAAGFLGYEGKVASNNILRTISRSANMSVILAFAICLGLFVSSIFTSVEANIESEVNRSFGGNLQFSTETPLTSEKLGVIKQFDGVQGVMAYKEKEVLWSSDKKTNRFTIIGTDADWYQSHPLFYDTQKNHIDLLRLLKEQSDGVLLGDYAFREWGGKVGDPITIIQNDQEKVLTVLGKVGTSQYGGYTAFMEANHFDKLFPDSEPYRGLITVGELSVEKRVKDSLLQTFPFDLERVQTSQEELDKQKRALPGIQALFNGLLLISIIVAGIGILNTLVMNVMDRVREIGVMRAVAFTAGQVTKSIVGESVMMGICGTLMGIITGILMTYVNTLTMETAASFVIPIDTLILSAICGILISLLAAVIPAQKAVRYRLDQALKQD